MKKFKVRTGLRLALDIGVTALLWFVIAEIPSYVRDHGHIAEREFTVDDLSMSHRYKHSTVAMKSVHYVVIVSGLALVLSDYLYCVKKNVKFTVTRAAVMLVAAAQTYALGWAFTNVLKVCFARLRPYFLHICWPVEGATGLAAHECRGTPSSIFSARLSFPSGHSCGGGSASTLFIVAILAVPKGYLSFHARSSLIVLASVWGLFVAASRTWDYHHFPSDVIAGLAIAAGCNALVLRCFASMAGAYGLHAPSLKERSSARSEKELSGEDLA